MKRPQFTNMKIRNQLMFIFFFCVLIPIVVTDAIILSTVRRNVEAERRKEIEYLMERIDNNLTETVQGCMLFTNNLYRDSMLDEFLNRRYINYVDYYDNYYQLIRYNNLSYNYFNGILTKIQIYTNNDTILTGGKLAKLDDAMDTEWYKAYVDSGKDTMLCAYFDDTKRYTPGGGTPRTVSVIRRLNHFADKSFNKILKIDIDYWQMEQYIINEKMDAEIFVRNKDIVLFSNLSSEGSMREFMPASSLSITEETMTREVIINGDVWEVVVKPNDLKVWLSLTENAGIISMILVNILIPSILILFFSKSVSKRLSLVASHMDKVKREQFEEITGISGEDEIGKLINSYNIMIRKIRNLIQVVFKNQAEKQALEISRKQAELKAVQSQVNPHFLNNTLESIRMRSLIKGEKETAEIIGELALLFRKSMTWGSDYVTIGEELSFVEKYINIQRYRFGDKIRYNQYVMEGCSEYRVPKLALATFVENACVHGIEGTAEDGVISLNITKNSEYLFIEISDNGVGVEQDKLQELREMLEHASSEMLNEAKSTGILNAFLRIKMYSEGKVQFSIDSSSEGGTDILIQLPLNHQEKAGNDTEREVTTNDSRNDC